MGDYVVSNNGFDCVITDITYAKLQSYAGTCEVVSPVSGEPYTSGVINSYVSTELAYCNFVVTGIGSGAFDESPVTEVNLPSYLEYISYGAFANSSLQSINLPNSLDNIAPGAFAGCMNFTSVRYNNSEKFSVSDYMILDNDGTRVVSYLCGSPEEDVVLHEGITTIAPQAFYGAANIKSIEIPESIKEIGYEAFMDAANLTKVTSLAPEASEVTVDNTSFMGMNTNAVLYVPASALSGYQESVEWSEFFVDVLPLGTPGDIDGDGSIDVNDLGALVNIICGLGEDSPNADVDSNGTVEIADLGALINAICGL